ncbi:MAG: cytochrome c, partial [Acidobacteriia bacterium]|nr:cytochrome c [Terriglobia bacterium]
MNKWKAVVLLLIAVVVIAALYGAAVIRRGFSAVDQPSTFETVAARTVRNLGIPGTARDAKNPWAPTPEALQQAREDFTNHCAGCHGKDGDGQSGIARNLYPK